jgi:hypothetical protein
MDNNKLIAEFMGVPQGKHTHFMVEPFALESYADVDDLKYDASWDWLMPVVHKIEQVNEGVPQQMLHINLYSERREVYQAVVEFIKTYNDER